MAALLALAACAQSSGDDPTTRALERRVVDLGRAKEILAVADRTERLLPDAGDRTFTSSVAALLEHFDSAEVRVEKSPKFTGVVKAESLLIRFGGGAADAVAVLDAMARIDRPWKLDRLVAEDGVVGIEAHAYVFAAGVLKEMPSRTSSSPRSKALRRRVAELENALAKSGVDQTQLARIRRIAMKQSLVGDLDAKATARAADAKVFIDAVRETRLLPKALAFDDSRGKQRCTVSFAAAGDRSKFLSATVRRGAIRDRKKNELILASGRVCRVSVSDE